jgi:hypothetical protein
LGRRARQEELWRRYQGDSLLEEVWHPCRLELLKAAWNWMPRLLLAEWWRPYPLEYDHCLAELCQNRLTLQIESIINKCATELISPLFSFK